MHLIGPRPAFAFGGFCHTRMREGNIFSHVFLSVCTSVYNGRGDSTALVGQILLSSGYRLRFRIRGPGFDSSSELNWHFISVLNTSLQYQDQI